MGPAQGKNVMSLGYGNCWNGFWCACGMYDQAHLCLRLKNASFVDFLYLDECSALKIGKVLGLQVHQESCIEEWRLRYRRSHGVFS